MATFISNSPEETECFAEEFARSALPGWVIALHGDLGAGKTCFVRGFARGLGIQSRIQSPTFALVVGHPGGRVLLHHLDLYRLNSTEEILAAGLEEYFHPTDSVSLVEWYERWSGPQPPAFGRVTLSHAGETCRRIETELP